MEAQNRLLPEWFNRIQTGQIRLPRFQRFEAWGYGEVGGLLEAVIRGLPSGAALTLEVGDSEQFVSRTMEGAPEPTERASEHLLDGQQRLTALWKSLNDLYEDRTYFIYFDQDEEHENRMLPYVWSQARWQKNGTMYPVWADDPAQQWSRGCVPLKLLRPGDLMSEILAWCGEASDGDDELQNKLLTDIINLREAVNAYNVPFLALRASTPKDVALDVFIKLNTSSVKLTPFDIIVAQVEEATDESLHQRVNELVAAVPAVSSYALPQDFVLSVAAMREDRPPTQASYHRLDLPRLMEQWDALVEGARWMVQCLEEERIFDDVRLPTVAVLPVLAAIHEHMPSDLDARGDARKIVRQYLWRSFMTRRYENTASQRSLRDLRGLVALISGNGEVPEDFILNEHDFPLPDEDALIRAGWPKKKDILARGILALSIRRGANDLADDEPASRSHLPSREYHHLFPVSLLRDDGGISESRAYRALNCALVTWKTNRNISRKDPLVYLKERTQSSIEGRLRAHMIPLDELSVGGYAMITDETQRATRIVDDYDRFLQARAKMMMSPIRSLCDGVEPFV